jgi:class 3 adenylate cyclase/tetratricopeptide (TPR) repeat protein
MTVLFCDLVNSTGIARQLDPEEWRELIAEYHRAVAEGITRYSGYVAQYQGDGVMAYFGWPEAHENDAERAARAALAVLESVSLLNQKPLHATLAARVGIHSGAVVVGTGAGKSADIFGDTPNIAARLQAAAIPNTVLITADTRRLVSGLFVTEDCGAKVLKGIEQPIQVYRVIQPSGVRGRLEAMAAARGLMPFVGRDDELRLLMNRWERVHKGDGQVVLIIGEAGIGKSRLVEKFHELIAATPHIWVEAAAAPFYQNTPFYPVVEVLSHLVWKANSDRFDNYRRQLEGKECKPDDQTAVNDAQSYEVGAMEHSRVHDMRDSYATDRLEQLQIQIAAAGLTPAEAIPLIAPLFNLPLTEAYSPSPLSPEQQRRRLLVTLVQLLLSVAHSQPLVVVIEDLHWADSSTLELIQVLVEQCAVARLLLVCTARLEFRSKWPLPAHHVQLTLNRLSPQDARLIVGHVAQGKALPEETVKVVVERTGGVPLFVEELTHAVLEKSDAKVSAHEIPATLRDSLMARLDRLGPAKEIIQIGAVIGSEFSYDLLHALHLITEENLRSALRQASEADLLRMRGTGSNATYLFKHALIRDVAYGALLRSRRKELHRLVARTIEQEFSAFKNAHPQVLARHWTEAGETESAIAEWSRAGKAARERNAFTEAEESYGYALSLVEQLPESPERDLAEIKLRWSNVAVRQITKGWAAPETTKAADRIALLAERSGDLVQLGNSIAAKAFTAWVAGNLSAAGTLADQALELALRGGSPTILAFRYLLQLMVRYWRGDLAGAEQHFELGLKFFDDPGLRRAPLGAAVAFYYYGAFTAWTLGRAQLARMRLAQMMCAVNANNPHDLASVGHFAASLRICMGEYEQAATLAAQALEVAEDQFPNEAAMERIVLGQARAQLGHSAEGIALMRQGIVAMLESGQRLGVGIQSARLAQAQSSAGFLNDALDTMERAQQYDFDEPIFRPEILKVRGELRLKQQQTDIAESHFREAIALAHRMGAKAWELRAAMSLAGLLRDTNRRHEARTILAEIYNWFTEGFDTADLKEAKALLDELSR